MTLVHHRRAFGRTALILTLLCAVFTVDHMPCAQAEPVTAEKYMVSSANPHASAAGLEMLRQGGSATDAAIAMQLVLSLVEPQSSGVGGGGFLLHWQAHSQSLVAYDGREKAPMSMPEDAFLNEEGTPLGFFEAAFGGLPVGVPGIFRLFEQAHADHGVLPWPALFEPAIRLARDGFEISPRLYYLLNFYAKRVSQSVNSPADLGPAGAYFFTDDWQAKPAGTLLKNPAYGELLQTIARDGAGAFYSGPIAQDIVDAVSASGLSKGYLTLDDLARYEPVVRKPVCGDYRAHTICSMGPPSSGGTTMLAILGMLDGFDLAAEGGQTAKSVHLFAEASRLAYADRDRYIGDPDFVSVPTQGLIDSGYLAKRRALIDVDQAMAEVSAGTPPSDHGHFAPHEGPDYPSTSHMVAIDRAGNAVSFTTTVQAAFGSLVMTHGFLLNNQLTDFSFVPARDGTAVANRVAGGKRPRSSMTPTVIFDDQGRLVGLVGSPGGSRIISYVAKAIVGLLDWQMDIQAAIELPNMVNRGTVLEMERETSLSALEALLSAKGHQVQLRNLNSGLHGITIHYGPDGTVDRLEGGADPRREGVALGD